MTLSNKSVLVVEDEPVVRKLLRRHLKDYTIFEASNGVEGYEAFLEHEPDVVITDLKMPKRDGLTLFKMIREHSPLTPVVVLSGVGKKADVIEILRLGAHNYLEKPIHNQGIVVHAVEKAFEMLNLEKANQNYQHNLEKIVAEKTAELRAELTARDKAEKELLRAQKEWEKTFDAIPDLIAIIDNDFRIIKSNKAMNDTLGIIPDNKKEFFCYKVIHGTDSPPSYCPHVKLLEDGCKHIVETCEEKLGGHFEFTVIPYFADDGQSLLGSVHIARNINDLKEMESDREKMQIERLHTQKLESVGQLAAGIAHEINTPVQFVSTNNDFLEESFGNIGGLIASYEKLLGAAKQDLVSDSLVVDVEASKETAEWEYLEEEIPAALRQSQEGLKRVASIVRAMKEFSHPGSKEKERRNLNDILQTTGIVARNEWKYVSELKMDLDENLPAVMCYSDDMGQVFLNVLINAAHAIEDRLGRNPVGDKGKITVTTGEVNGYAEVRIADTGKGMSPEILSKIFDPFYTTKKVGRGTGQGLAIAWNIITEKHKGEFKVESEAGEGTTFIIKVPL